MKKIASVLLVLAMVMSLNVGIYATELDINDETVIGEREVMDNLPEMTEEEKQQLIAENEHSKIRVENESQPEMSAAEILQTVNV